MGYNTGVINQKSDRSGAGNTLRSEQVLTGELTVSHSTSDVLCLKTCSKCKETKPATIEYFSRDAATRDGFCSRCKTCHRGVSRAHYAANKDRERARRRAQHKANRDRELEYKRTYYKANQDRLREEARAYREANRERLKEERLVHREANREYLAEQRRAHYEANKERVKAQNRAWYKANRERDLARGRAYREANPERVAERHRVYYEANKERLAGYGRAWRESNRVRIAERQRAWRKANPEHARAAVRNYQARKRNAEGSHTAAEIEEQYKAQKGRCYYCHAKVGNKFDADHVVPLSRGGSNGPENLVIACPTCNRSKNDKLPHEWPKGGRLL